MSKIDSPEHNDNRNYDYTNVQSEDREEYKLICELVKPNSKVVDLGCGNGSLLQKLIKEKNVICEGVELSVSGVEVCKSKGLKVHHGRIDEKLFYNDNAFDYSICNVTMQMVVYPEVLLKEMKRISKYQIISFPNFGYYKNRLDLLFSGRMPKPMLFGYKWYNTGHIHQLSIKDFYEIIDDVGSLRILKKEYILGKSSIKKIITSLFPNLFVPILIMMLASTND
jgi:methionine biosynthesis protein MetW